MEDIGYAIAIVAVIIGTLFSVVGVVGLVRLPDVYTRMHATGKVATFGVVLLSMAAALVLPSTWGKALILIGVLVLAGPVVSHAIASAAYRLGLPMKGVVRDDLAAHKVDVRT
jgi:multicomponent Na+:H+ antiporter subunit G